MNVEIGAAAALFPEKEYINGIAVAVYKMKVIYENNPTLQMKGRCESNINVWFPFMYSQKWICSLFSLLIFITEL